MGDCGQEWKSNKNDGIRRFLSGKQSEVGLMMGWFSGNWKATASLLVASNTNRLMKLARREARVDSQWGRKFKEKEKTRTPPGGPPEQETRKRDGTMGL